MSKLFTEINNAQSQQAQQIKNFEANIQASSSPASPSKQPSAPQSADSPTLSSTSNHPIQPNDRTVTPNGYPAQSKPSSSASPSDVVSVTIDPGTKDKSVMAELASGPAYETKRLTERYSFEIYTDQIHKINRLKYLYYERFSKHLSKSRIIRDALDEMLDQALETLETISESK